MKVTNIPFVIGALGTITKGLVQGQEGLDIRGRDPPDYCIIKIGQNIEKSPGYLRRLAVAQTPVKKYRIHNDIFNRV